MNNETDDESGKKAIFVDRDGTINKEKNYLYKISDFEYLEGAIDGLKALCKMGFIIVIVTNQSGIARGYYSEEDYLALDKWMREYLSEKGVQIAASYYCPHFAEGIISRYAIECECRKPKTGMFWQAARELNLDMNKGFAIGDKMRDLSICFESGVKGILLSGEKTMDSKYKVCSDWNEIVNYIYEAENRTSCRLE